MADCDTTSNPTGILVEIPELKVSLLTDKNGRFSFLTSNLQRSYRVNLSRSGSYPRKTSMSVNYEEDSGRYMAQELYLIDYQSFSGAIKDSVVFIQRLDPYVRDSVVDDGTGFITTIKIWDTVDASYFQLWIKGLDENDKQSSKLTAELLVTRSQSIDVDWFEKSVLWGVGTRQETSGFLPVQVQVSGLRSAGLKSGEKFYVFASANSTCPFGAIGTRHSPVIELTMP
jgi:hypothetical protein